MKKIIKNVSLILLIILLGITFIIKGTHSKYINSVTGNGETEVAKWKFNVNGETEQIETIKLIDTYSEDTLSNGKIAPGTKGSFDLIIDATESEVGVEYNVDFKNEVNKPMNLKFTYGNQELDNLEDCEQYLSGIIDSNDNNKIRILTINWEWPYETGNQESTINQNDNIDTNDGINALDYTFDVVVTGTQVIPQK